MTIAEQLRHQGYEKGVLAGMQQGVLEGKAEGEHEKALTIARNMLFKNADFYFVKEVTGLSDQDLSKLVKSH